MKTTLRFLPCSTLLILLVSLGPALHAAPPDAQRVRNAETRKSRHPPRPISPDIGPNGRVTFRFDAPGAKEVSVAGEFPGGGKMVKDDRGIWSITVGPVQPELYHYAFIVDGLRVADPSNQKIKPSRSLTTSILDVPGDPPLVHDFQNVPHGTVHVHYYRSKATNSLRRLHVYTPPGYEQDTDAGYPTLYLLHGSGDSDATWTVLGRAHWILDNLIAQGKVTPMVVVMPDGHANPPNPITGPNGKYYRSNSEVFEQDLLTEVMPLVEATYRVKPDRLSRGIIGLSMGGGQSLNIGLNHLELFAWVGGMSAGIRDPEKSMAGLLADPNAANQKLQLLWIACGKDDLLIDASREFSELLDSKGIKHTFRETDGVHTWWVWRKYLTEFAPLVFVNEQ